MKLSIICDFVLGSLLTCMPLSKAQGVLNIMDVCFHSGYMGCYANIHVDQNNNGGSEHPHCFKITATVCDSLWSGVFFQYPDKCWCCENGLNLNGRSFTKISFFMKGETGNEVVQYKVGNDKCDSFTTFKETVYLTKDWQPFEISLKNADLSRLTCPFGWFIDFKRNPAEVTFYIDRLRFEK